MEIILLIAWPFFSSQHFRPNVIAMQHKSHRHPTVEIRRTQEIFQSEESYLILNALQFGGM